MTLEWPPMSAFSASGESVRGGHEAGSGGSAQPAADTRGDDRGERNIQGEDTLRRLVERLRPLGGRRLAGHTPHAVVL